MWKWTSGEFPDYLAMVTCRIPSHPDKSEVIGATCKVQRSNSGECNEIVTIYIHFLNCFNKEPKKLSSQENLKI